MCFVCWLRRNPSCPFRPTRFLGNVYKRWSLQAPLVFFPVPQHGHIREAYLEDRSLTRSTMHHYTFRIASMHFSLSLKFVPPPSATEYFQSIVYRGGAIIFFPVPPHDHIMEACREGRSVTRSILHHYSLRIAHRHFFFSS